MRNNLIFILLTIVITASTGMQFYFRSPSSTQIAEKILAGETSLTTSELIFFEDDSKVNAIYVDLFDNVIAHTPNLDQLKYLGASALIFEKNKSRKNNLRNLLMQLSFMNDFQRSQITQEYQSLLKDIVRKHFPEIVADLKKDNPNNEFFNF